MLAQEKSDYLEKYSKRNPDKFTPDNSLNSGK